MAKRSSRTRFAVESLESRQVLSAAPTAELQYALELVNLTRTNPGAAAERLTANLSSVTRETLSFYNVDLAREKRDIASAKPRQPLAWSETLAAAAEKHSRDMAERGFQSHTGSDGSSPEDRTRAAGYADAIRQAENAYAYADSVDQAMQAFTIDWGVADKGHRRNLLEQSTRLDDTFKEIGIGMATSRKLGGTKVMTQKLGVRKDAPAQLLGVAYTDRDRDNFYSIGEGQGGVTVELTGPNGQTQRVETSPAGGYQIALTPGRYRVRAFQGDREIQSREVTINKQNLKLDFLLSEAPAQVVQTPRTRRVETTTSPAAPTPKPTMTTQAPKNAKPANEPAPANAEVNVFPAKPVFIRIDTPEVVSIQPAAEPVISQASSGLGELFDRQSGFNWSTWKAIPRV